MSEEEIRISRGREAVQLTDRILLDMLDAFRDIRDTLVTLEDTIANK